MAQIDDNHAMFRDAAALEALGVLPQAASDSLRAHLHVCAPCMQEYRRLRPIADLLGYGVGSDELSSEPAEPAALKARVMRAARAARAPREGKPQALRAVPVDDLIDYAPGVKWAVVPAAGATMVYWSFDPPACGDIPAEKHDQTQVGFVLRGKMSMTYGDGSRAVYGPNEVYAISPGVQHGADFHEKTILVDVYTPNHTEFEELYAKQRERAKSDA